MFDFLGRLIDSGVSLWNASENRDAQKEFAQRGITWKVKDSKNAGIHPLFGLGAQTHSFSPVSVGTDFGGAGQALDREITATGSQAERSRVVQARANELQLENMELQNNILRSRLAIMNQPGTPPPQPTPDQAWLVPGQGQTQLPSVRGLPQAALAPGALIADQAMSRNRSDPMKPWQEPGAVADVGHTRTTDGLAPVYSEDAKQRLEDDWLGMLWWNIRNRLLPGLHTRGEPPMAPRPNHFWHFNIFTGEWQEIPVPHRGVRTIPYDYKSEGITGRRGGVY